MFQAYNCYLEALRIDPTFAIAWSNLAGLFMEGGDLNRALIYYKVIFFFLYSLSHISSKDIIPDNGPLRKYLLVLPSQRLILDESQYILFFVCFALLLSSCLIGLIISQWFSCA